MAKKPHGGKRINSGRKPKYNEPTKTISFRVPLSQIEPITEYVKGVLIKRQTALK